jgi:4'-phosphopantetheinyl transferase
MNPPRLDDAHGSLGLADGDAHLHLLHCDAGSDAQAWLTPEEQNRHDRYLSAAKRREYRLARALLRRALSRYADLPPSAWRFRTDRHGRPSIALPRLPTPLHFNQSHTEGLIACLVSRHGEVGVDVEYTPRRLLAAGIAESHFAPSEVQALRALPAAGQRERFFALWTLKEAYIKARGLGLALPLDGFHFDLAGVTPTIAFAPGFDDTCTGWHFQRLHLSPDHAAALALRLPAAVPPRLTIHVYSTAAAV